MMLVLEKLWKGTLSAGEHPYLPYKDYSPFYEAKERCETMLKEELSEAGQKALKDYIDANIGVAALADCESFMDGFRMGAMMMIDVLGQPQ